MERCFQLLGISLALAKLQEGEKGEGGETERVKKKVGRGSVGEYDEGHKGGDREGGGMERGEMHC